MKTKVCKKCNIEKSIDNFRTKYEKRFGKSYLYSYCKECEKGFHKKYAIDNKEKIKEYNKQYNSNHECHDAYSKIYYKNHKKEINEKRIAYRKKKREKDKIYQFKERIRPLIWISFNSKGFSKNTKTEKLLGCSFEIFYEHLLNTFKQNYGYDFDFKEKVHIDHVIPLATAKTKEDVVKLSHYTNLQLLKAKDNMAKRDKLDWQLEVPIING